MAKKTEEVDYVMERFLKELAQLKLEEKEESKAKADEEKDAKVDAASARAEAADKDR